MLSPLSRRSLAALRSSGVIRTLATGPQAGGTISDELLQKLGSLSTQGIKGTMYTLQT